MSVATQLMAEAEQARAEQRREETERLDAKEKERTERQLAIFDAAKVTFQLCLAAARVSARRSAQCSEFELASGRFEKSDFNSRLNEWNMVVLALRENEITANLVWHESEDHDELGGRGRCTVYTPKIVMSWPTKA